MTQRGLGREQIREIAWRESYPHPVVSCLMPGIAILAILALGIFSFFFWQLSLPGDTTVPTVVGHRLEEAEVLLQNAGLTVQVAKDWQHDETIASGLVLSTVPAYGRRVKRGRTITIVVSAGTNFTHMPEVRELPESAARDRLRQAGLTVALEEYTYHPTIPYDRVISASQNSGAQLKRDTTVNLVISGGAKPTSSDADLTSDRHSTVLNIDLPTDTSDAAEVRIDVTDDNGTRTVYQETHKPGDNVTENVEGTGSVTAEVYFGDRLILTRKF